MTVPNKPSRGSANWDVPLNNALDWLDAKIDALNIADVADFTFISGDGEGPSSINIHNHDMLIQTTRDGSQDSDIDINSADDVWITANDSVEITSVTDDVRIYTNDGSHEWSFQSNGSLRFPDGTFQTTANSLGDIKTRVWGYPSENAIAVMPTVDGESIALKSSDAAAIRWHVRNNTGPIEPLSATVTSGEGYEVVFTINEQNSVPAVGEGYYYQISCPGNSAYDGAFTALSATTTSITFIYEADPGAFDPTDASISQPSVYSQFEVDENGAHIKIADWTGGPGGYSHYWDFTKEGAIHFPYGPSNSRTGSGDVLRFASSFDQSIITGAPATFANPTANRLVIAGQDGAAGDGFDGEGGDIYLWAGRGGGTNGDGGDIKIDGGDGQGTGEGGYVKVRGGYSADNEGGFVEITAGSSSNSTGGTVTINAGDNYTDTESYGGSVNINAGSSGNAMGGGSIALSTSNAGGINLNANGKVLLNGQNGEFLNDSAVPGNQIATISDLPTGATGSFTSQDGKTVTVTNGIITSIV